MDKFDQKMKSLKRLDLFFLISGLIEVFSFVFLTHSFYLVIIGGITVYTAYIALSENKWKWNYFIGIWALVKYNPLGLAMISFMLSDALRNSVGGPMPVIIVSLAFLVFILAILSFIIGIILIVKTVRYAKSQNKTLND